MAGESASTRKALINEAGFQPSDFNEGPGAAAQRLNLASSGPSKGFNERTMSQSERDAELKRQKAEADANRLANMYRRKK